MKIEDKCVSLELAKRMYDLGWRYDTERYWVKYQSPYNNGFSLSRNLQGNMNKCPIIEHYPAPDAIEIGERLPENIYYNDCWYFYRDFKCRDNRVIIQYRNNSNLILISMCYPEAESRGKMWCYLKEKGLLCQ